MQIHKSEEEKWCLYNTDPLKWSGLLSYLVMREYPWEHGVLAPLWTSASSILDHVQDLWTWCRNSPTVGRVCEQTDEGKLLIWFSIIHLHLWKLLLLNQSQFSVTKDMYCILCTDWHPLLVKSGEPKQHNGNWKPHAGGYYFVNADGKPYWRSW